MLKSQIILAVFAALIVACIVAYAAFMRKDSKESFESEEKQGLNVVKMFDVLLNRNPSPEEIQKYKGLKDDKSAIAAIISDYKIDLNDDSKKVMQHEMQDKAAEIKKEPANKRDDKPQPDGEETMNVETYAKDVDKMDADGQKEYNGAWSKSGLLQKPSPRSDVDDRYAPVDFAKKESSFNNISINSNIHESKKASGTSSGVVSLERGEILKRLNTIASELQYFADAARRQS